MGMPILSFDFVGTYGTVVSLGRERCFVQTRSYLAITLCLYQVTQQQRRAHRQRCVDHRLHGRHSLGMHQAARRDLILKHETNSRERAISSVIVTTNVQT